MPSYWKKASIIQQEYMDKLEKMDLETLNLITKKYEELLAKLGSQVTELSQIKYKTASQIIKLDAYKSFIVDLKVETAKFNVKSVNIISGKQLEFIQLGLESSQKIIGLVGVKFQKLNPDALKWIVGNSMNGGRLKNLLDSSYTADSVKKITDTLIQGVTIGRNPRDTARLIKEDMAGDLARALRISRTETIQAYRESSREQMKESGLVDEWEWLSEEDACDFCLGNNGKRFPVSEPFDTHPNCRCTNLPILNIGDKT